MKTHIAALSAAAVLTAGCTGSQLIDSTDKTIELMGGPAMSFSRGQVIEYHQPEADRLCRERGAKRAQFAGENVDLYIASYTFICVD